MAPLSGSGAKLVLFPELKFIFICNSFFDTELPMSVLKIYKFASFALTHFASILHEYKVTCDQELVIFFQNHKRSNLRRKTKESRETFLSDFPYSESEAISIPRQQTQPRKMPKQLSVPQLPNKLCASRSRPLTITKLLTLVPRLIW